MSKVDEDASIEGDLNRVAQMSLEDVALARPSRITVCADDEYIHSI